MSVAGLRAVPQPLTASGSAVLMEYVGDADEPAPLLRHVPLGREEAAYVLDRVLRNIELFLACDIVHADLSAFNILYREERVCIIDFPQSVDPWLNPRAQRLLARDGRNVCRHFARHGVDADARRIADELGRFYLVAVLLFEKLLFFEPESPRGRWAIQTVRDTVAALSSRRGRSSRQRAES